MQYKPATHLAKRNGQFYKGSKIAVGVILSLSVMLSAFGFSYLSYERIIKRSYRMITYFGAEIRIIVSAMQISKISPPIRSWRP